MRDAGDYLTRKRGARSKAELYGQAARREPARSVLTAWHMLLNEGLAETWVHSRKQVIWRLHDRFVDGPRLRSLPMHRKTAVTPLSHGSLATEFEAEIDGAKTYQHVPSLMLKWSLNSLKINFAEYSFVDVGSGYGYATVTAAEFPFTQVVGIELVRELHEGAVENLAWAKKQPQTLCKTLVSRHESALTANLPAGPLVVFLFNPFDEEVMKAFVDRLVQHARGDEKSSIYVLYLNPVHADVLEAAEGISELPLTGISGLKIRVLGAIKARVFAWNLSTTT